MTQARFELDEYSTQVLDVVKGKYRLKNRNEALQKFIHEYGNDFVEPKYNESVLEQLDLLVEQHQKKYPKRTMTLQELDTVLNIE